jgi:hypothetical protein
MNAAQTDENPSKVGAVASPSRLTKPPTRLIVQRLGRSRNDVALEGLVDSIASPCRDDATRPLDHRNDRHDVVSLQAVFDDKIDVT